MKRRNHLPALLTVLGVALTAVVLQGGFGSRGADAIVLDAGTSAETTLTIVWGGDTMLADASDAYTAQYGYPWVFEKVTHTLDADVVVVNHEAPITALDEPFDAKKLYSYSAEPTSAPAIRDAGVTVLSLANNHVMDMGPIGLADTLAHAGEAGLVCIGAGADDVEAERPLLVRSGDVTVGIVALAKGYGSSVTAGRGHPGTIALSEASIARGQALARRAGADYVVAFVHWGENYEPEVLEEQRKVARDFAEAGYDLVIGHGPHVPQRAEMIGTMPVIYSLGNFVFGTGGRFNEANPGEGIILRTEFTARGLASISAIGIDTDNDRVMFQPRPMTPGASAVVLDRLGYTSVIAQLDTSRAP